MTLPDKLGLSELASPCGAFYGPICIDTHSLPIHEVVLENRRHVLPDGGMVHKEVLAAALEYSS